MTKIICDDGHDPTVIKAREDCPMCGGEDQNDICDDWCPKVVAASTGPVDHSATVAIWLKYIGNHDAKDCDLCE